MSVTQGRCRDCRHWGAAHRENCSGAECLLPHHGTGSSIEDPVWDRAEAPARKAGEGHRNIRTGPLFCCVHFEKKKGLAG